MARQAARRSAWWPSRRSAQRPAQSTAQRAARQSRSADPPIRVFDPPVRVPSRHGAAVIVTLATWALLVVTVPLYFVFLLNSLPELFAVMANLRAPRGHTDDSDVAPD